MNYDTMTDRELDAAVAEKVMGWTPCDRVAMGWGSGPLVYLTGNENNPTWQDFSPSTDIAEAWQVVEKMREKGYRWLSGADERNDPYEMTFHPQLKPKNEPGGGYATHANPARAICIAALKALEAQA